MTKTTFLVLVAIAIACLSIVLIQEVRVLRAKLKGIRRHLRSPLPNWTRGEVSQKLFMSTKWEPLLQRPRNKRAQDVWTSNVTVIPWMVAIQKGLAATTSDNKIIVHQDSYFMVFGQVLFYNQGTIMGHLIRQQLSRPSGPDTGHPELLRCLQEMPQESAANTCFSAGIVKLDRNVQLELVIPDRPHAQVAMDTESTFFGIIQLQ